MSHDSDLLQRTLVHARTYLDTVATRPVRPTADRAALRAALGADAPLPAAGEPATAVIDRLAAAAETGTVATQGPRYFGFVVGGSLPVATAADWLVSAWDQNCGIYALSPLVSVAEDAAASWVRDVAGLSNDWTVGFVTGCQMANYTAVVTARHHLLESAGWDVEAKGLFGAPPIDVVVSDESHYTIFNALRFAGLGDQRVRRIPTDGQGRMRADALASALAGGTGPCFICAQAGNVNTGAFDPLEAIADAARARGAWLHVDGAFGFWAAASPAQRHLTAGIHRADSIATDAHKWLNVPYDCGIVLTAHAASHRRAMTQGAAYIVETPTERDPARVRPGGITAGPRRHGLRGAARARTRRPRRSYRAQLPPGGAHGGPASRASERRDSERRGAESGARARLGRGPRRRRAHPGRHRACAGGRHVLARRHDLARHGGHADLDQ